MIKKKFINHVSLKGKNHENVSFIIPLYFFGITKPFIFIEIPYFGLDEVKLKQFLKNSANSLLLD